jgi:heme-degrading monooxygenase HmoA
MVKLADMDEKVTFFQQMEEDGDPVIVINKFNVNPNEIDEFLKIFAESAQIWKKLPGFISTQLHRGTAGSSIFVNYIVFESPEHVKQAFNNPDFQSKIA